MVLCCHLPLKKETSSLCCTLYKYVSIVRVYIPNLESTKTIMLYEDVLPSTTPTYEYKGIQDSLQILDRELEDSSNPYIVFIIDERSFLDCFENSEEGLLRTSWDTYDPSSNRLVVRMQTIIHSSASGSFASIFSSWPKDDNYRLIPMTKASVRGQSGMNKQADYSWTPIQSGRLKEFPTMVVEIAWSETRTKLVEDMNFWLSQCYGEVRTALSITVHARGKITIEKWELQGATPIPSHPENGDRTKTRTKMREDPRAPPPRS